MSDIELHEVDFNVKTYSGEIVELVNQILVDICVQGVENCNKDNEIFIKRVEMQGELNSILEKFRYFLNKNKKYIQGKRLSWSY